MAHIAFVRRPVVLLHGFASSPATLAFLARHVRQS
jgi:esterase/lipase